jgi:hypothetical protein
MALASAAGHFGRLTLMNTLGAHAKKALASLVILFCLGMQTLEILRPHRGKLWPVLDYPMYSSNAQPGAIARTRVLRAASCDSPPRVWQISEREIGHLSFRLRARLAEIALDRASADADRAALSQVVAAHVKPRPCALQVWEREVATTSDGVDPSAITHPQWTLRRAWALDRP